MSFAFKGHGPLDYKLVTYEGSQMWFRGPQIDLPSRFCCVWAALRHSANSCRSPILNACWWRWGALWQIWPQ